MPGAAYGRTWLRTVSQRVAPTPKAASRIEIGHGAQRLGGGDHHDGQHHDGQRQAAGDQDLAHAQQGDEDRQAEQAVDDGWDARQVPDVGPDQAGRARVMGVLLQVDRRTHTQRQGKQDHEQDQQDRSDQALQDAGGRRAGRQRREEEVRPAAVAKTGNDLMMMSASSTTSTPRLISSETSRPISSARLRQSVVWPRSRCSTDLRRVHGLDPDRPSVGPPHAPDEARHSSGSGQA